MIIARYLTRQVSLTTAAITFILLVVVVVGRALKYLAQASQGELDPSVLAILMAYRLPEFLQLIMPLALLLGILLSYGRMYAESEMVVLTACGLSRRRLFALTLLPALGVAALVGLLSLQVTPWGLVNTQRLLEAQEELTEFEILVPGLFQSISRGQRTTYTESVRENRLQNLFMHETGANRVTVADNAVPIEDGEGSRFILLREGSISQGVSGSEDYTLTGFDELGLRVPERELDLDLDTEEKAMPTTALLGAGEPAAQAELQWRLSLVLLIPVLTLLAIPLSRVSPREGRFGRLVPSILIYIAYFGLLLASRDLVGRGQLAPLLGLWWVHLVFLALALLLFFDRLKNPLHLRRRRAGN